MKNILKRPADTFTALHQLFGKGPPSIVCTTSDLDRIKEVEMAELLLANYNLPGEDDVSLIDLSIRMGQAGHVPVGLLLTCAVWEQRDRLDERFKVDRAVGGIYGDIELHFTGTLYRLGEEVITPSMRFMPFKGGWNGGYHKITKGFRSNARHVVMRNPRNVLAL